MSTAVILNQNHKLLLAPKTRCATASKRNCRRTVVLLLTLILSAAIVAAAYFYFQPAALTHPDFDSSAVSGTPIVGSKYGYSTLAVNNGYSIQLCGLPRIEGEDVYFYLTNPSDNNVWFRAEVMDDEGNLLASTGVLKQGEYIPSIQLNSSLKDIETAVVVRIIGYKPNTWHSAGNVSLRINLS